MSKKKSLAEKADKHILYQKSVQTADTEIEFALQVYREINEMEPEIFREDFCGTALLSTEWAKQGKDYRAIGVDLCQSTLDWGLKNNIKPAGKGIAQRVTLLNENVLSVKAENVDVACAFNFSYCIFETRDLLRQYFANVRSSLAEDGLFFLDLLGGTSTTDVVEEERPIEDEDFIYIWEQEYYNPINAHLECHIHFEFTDGSRMDKAFSYSWRLWSLPEIKEILLEAGYSNVHIYWEGFEEDDDPDNEYLTGTGEYQQITEVDQQESWLAYIVAER